MEKSRELGQRYHTINKIQSSVIWLSSQETFMGMPQVLRAKETSILGIGEIKWDKLLKMLTLLVQLQALLSKATSYLKAWRIERLILSTLFIRSLGAPRPLSNFLMTLTVRKAALCREQITLRQKHWQLLRKLKSLLCQWALLATAQDHRQRNQKYHLSGRGAVGNLKPIFLSKDQ